MEIAIKNCNCIDEAKIQLEEGKLNIKYAMNGTGKSTISKAIELSIEGKEAIKALKPFKYLDSVDDPKFHPSAEGAETIKTVRIFNEDYIKQFAFKPDEVITNSFEIFVRTPEYDQGMNDIEVAFGDIKQTFTNNQELESVIRDLSELSNGFGKSASGYSKAGAIHKGIGGGNKLENIPVGLEPYKMFLRSSVNLKWLKWQIGGKEFLDISNECPYCVSSTEEKKKETILLIDKEYDSKTIEHLNNILRLLDSLSKYFSSETNTNLSKITKNKTTISQEEINYLTQIKNDIDLLEEKLSVLKNISFFSFKDVDKVIDELGKYQIKIEFLPKLDSEHTREIVGSINTTLENLIKKATDIQKAIGTQKNHIKKTIQIYKKEINTFLQYAGYKYLVDIEEENDVYKMKLKHVDSQINLQKGDQHLSYGEKNAFTLVLFMYDAIRLNPDLIVLDDPISSFDRNKKYAILDTLFRREKSFKDKTVLMMTHDFEPVIDMVHSLAGKFKNPVASFLQADGGIITEIPITRQDVVTFHEVCHDNLASGCDDVIKLVYLRRSYEVVGIKSSAYQLISNLLHKRKIPLWKDSTGERDMTSDEISEASNEIRKNILDFDFNKIYVRLVDDAEMLSVYKAATNNYEKLQVYRIINIDKTLHESDVVSKFIKEVFHIENEYLMQLNPNKYQTTPTYIIDECNKSLGIN